MKNLDYDAAIAAADSGLPVRRAKWASGDHLVRARIDGKRGEVLVMQNTSGIIHGVWQAMKTDKAADDWEVLR